MHVLVTGGTGTLGRAVVPALLRAGHTVRVMSRRPRAGDGPAFGSDSGSGVGSDDGSGVEWARADLSNGSGLPEALAGVDTVVHLASAPYRGPYTARVDVQGTARLMVAARSAGVGHVVFVSIVGADRVPWGYFRQKVAAERAIRHGGVDWSIVRLTQFHQFLNRAFRGIGALPRQVTDPGIRAQPVAPSDAAERLVRRVGEGPTGEIEEFGGPETLDGDEALRQWLRARGRPERVAALRVPGRLGRAFRAGGLTTTASPAGRITWADYLASRYGSGGRDGAGRTGEGGGQDTGGRTGAGGWGGDGWGGTRTRWLDPERKRRMVVWFERYVQNPPTRAALRAGLPVPMLALLETTGRKTGQLRHTPLVDGRDGDTFWIVAEHGRRASYVRNLEAEPRVRVRIRGRWRTGTARILDGDDPIARASWMASRLGPMHKADALVARLLGTTPATVRIDLDAADG